MEVRGDDEMDLDPRPPGDPAAAVAAPRGISLPVISRATAAEARITMEHRWNATVRVRNDVFCGPQLATAPPLQGLKSEPDRCHCTLDAVQALTDIPLDRTGRELLLTWCNLYNCASTENTCTDTDLDMALFNILFKRRPGHVSPVVVLDTAAISSKASPVVRSN